MLEDYTPSFPRLFYWIIFEKYRVKTALYWWSKGFSNQEAWYEAWAQTPEHFAELEQEPDFEEMIEKFPRWP